MIRRLICRLLRHDHTPGVVIFCKTEDGDTLISQPMDRWLAEHILANDVAPGAQFAGRTVHSCRIVVP